MALGTPSPAGQPATLAGALLAQSPLAMLLYDAAGRVVFANAAAEAYFGVRVADLPPGYSVLDDPQLQAAGVLPLLRRAYAGEAVAVPPLRYDASRTTGGPGRTVWTQGHCFPLRDAAGAVAHLAIVHVDVTAWAEAETALREASTALEQRNAMLQDQALELELSNQHLQDQAAELKAQTEELQATAGTLAARTGELETAWSAVEHERAVLGRILAQLPAAVAVYEGPELRIRAMSAAYRRIIGGRDVIGLPIRDALPDLGGQGFFELLEGVYATGDTARGVDVPARWDADGDGTPEDHVVDFTYAPLGGADGRPEGVVALVVDVGERWRLEAAERAARAAAEAAAAHLTAVLDSLPDAAAVFDAEWRYTYANSAARALHAELLALTGTPAPLAEGSVVGHVAWEVFPWLAGTKFDVESRRAVAERRLVEYVEHAEPLGRWFETRIVPLATGAIALNRDVTAQRAAEAERERLLASERQAADRARRLQRLTAQLNTATSREQIAHAIFEGALDAVSADAGSLALVHADADGRPTQLEVVRTGGYAQEVADRYRTFPVTPGRPLSEAVLRRAPTFVSSAEEWRTAFPGAAEDLTALGFAAFAGIPVVVGERVLAALSFSFRESRGFDEATRTFLGTLAEQCALALERQRLHEAELHHAARHTALLASVQDPFVALDRELRYTYVNPRAEALLGRPAAALLGRSVDDVFPEGRGTAIYEAIHRTLATGAAQQVEAYSVVVGRWIDARLYPAPDGLTLVLRDVTARRRAQDAASFMAEASRLLATSLDYTTTLRAVAEAAVPRLGDWCAVDLIADPTAGAWPPRVERLAVVHQDPETLALGAELMRRYPTDWSAERGMAAVLRSGTPFFLPEVPDEMLVAGARDAAHLELLRALRFASIIVVPLVARGLTLGALTLCMTESGHHYDEADLALAQDLAQRAATAIDNARLYRDAERQRVEAERARAEAEAANQAKSQFLATMSHELRTPLNAIGGYAELMGIGIHGPVTDDQREALARIQRSQQHLLGLINEVLNYARLEAGSVHFDLTTVGVLDALAVVETLVRPQVLAKGLALTVGPCDPQLSVRADAEKLRQVLLNLLSNATKFTDAGGRIAIACAAADAGAPAHDREPAVAITVTDTGLGIAPDQLERIFEPFVQVGRALHNPGEGTGLGLAISRDLARGMGGDLTVESTPGVGSTFTLTLPSA